MSQLKSRIVGEGTEAPDQLLANPFNYRRHPKAQLDALEGGLEELGWIQRVIVNTTTGHIVDGHARVELAIRREEPEVPVLYVELTEQEEKIALATIDPIAGMAYHDERQLQELLNSIETSNEALADFLDSITPDQKAAAAEADQSEIRAGLNERFLVPPFSILDARQGYWQDRKRNWLAIGIRSEEGRGQDGDRTGKGLTFAVSSQPPQVLTRKREIEERDGTPYSWAEFAEKYPEELKLGGDSIFDPVLAEIAYRWFCPDGGAILDPFAGGSVRGVVAAMLGYDYTGIELRKEQVEANRKNWNEIAAEGSIPQITESPDYQPELTPVEKRGTYLFKRDDLYSIAGIRGGKARACWHLSQGAPGLVTAGSRQSPQVNIVANIARRLGIPCRVHVPSGSLTPELVAAREAGAEIVQHKAGYNNVIIARAREDASESGWLEVPFGMQCQEAVTQTASQVENLPWGEFNRIVIPVGSGINLAGLLHGIKKAGKKVPIVGVRVGADPTDRLDEYAPKGWQKMVTIVKSKQDYHDKAEQTEIEGIKLDPIYEGKCLPFLEPGDLMWCVGIRQTATAEDAPLEERPNWINADSRNLDQYIPEDQKVDLIFSCPPYADLEVYSDDPADISNMEYDAFIEAYREIIAKSCARLKDNRFAFWVVGEVRNKKNGFYRNFLGDTIRAFEDAGLRFYNEAIYISPTGGVAMRASNMFRNSRKLAKTHQNVLIFTKGAAKGADPIKGLGEFLAAEFEQHRTLLQTHEKVLIFAKGKPEDAADELGDPIIADPEQFGGLDA